MPSLCLCKATKQFSTFPSILFRFTFSPASSLAISQCKPEGINLCAIPYVRPHTMRYREYGRKWIPWFPSSFFTNPIGIQWKRDTHRIGRQRLVIVTIITWKGNQISLVSNINTLSYVCTPYRATLRIVTILTMPSNFSLLISTGIPHSILTTHMNHVRMNGLIFGTTVIFLSPTWAYTANKLLASNDGIV